MTLKETIRKQLLEATKAKIEDQKSILRVILGEIDTQESRNNKPLSDDDCCRVIRKILQGVEEMLTYKPDDAKYKTEKECLSALLPKQLDEAGVLTALAAKIEEIKTAKSEGQATGIAMKSCKEQGLAVDGNLVKKVVLEIRR